jgi:Zn finger protein HypA/HybF involved in hydrogenase expression
MSDQTWQAAPSSAHYYPCQNCGARLEFAPGTNALKCPYCGHMQQLADTGRQVTEHSYDELARLPRKPVASLAKHVFACQKCGAKTESDAIADVCQFCGAPLVADVSSAEMVVPEAVLPFVVDRSGVREALRKWVKSRWFAPNKLKRVTETEGVKGTYLPHWTYDARTVSDYTGQRGEHYYTTETYTDSDGNTQTRQVQHTNWYPASGRVARDFDDVLVSATRRLDDEHIDKLTPWPLHLAQPYQPDYLAGYTALRYEVEPEAGLELAKGQMAKTIKTDCEHDIGGDEQRVDRVQTHYFDLMFKLMLLPVWLAAYLYAGKTYQVMVNAHTGEVVGQRPYSPWKIAFAVVAVVLVVAAICVLGYTGQHHR